jgi:hypothetical protein
MGETMGNGFLVAVRDGWATAGEFGSLGVTSNRERAYVADGDDGGSWELLYRCRREFGGGELVPAVELGERWAWRMLRGAGDGAGEVVDVLRHGVRVRPDGGGPVRAIAYGSAHWTFERPAVRS